MLGFNARFNVDGSLQNKALTVGLLPCMVVHKLTSFIWFIPALLEFQFVGGLFLRHGEGSIRIIHRDFLTAAERQ